jgi:WD40 repeat protein
MRVWRAHQGAVLGLVFAPGGGALATAGDGDPAARVWDLTAGAERFGLSLFREPALSLAFAPDGRTLAVARPEAVELWDSATGEQRHRLDAYRHRSRSLAFAPDGARLLSAGTQTAVSVSVQEEMLAVPGPTAEPLPVIPAGDAVQALTWDLATHHLHDIFTEATDGWPGLICALDGRTLLWCDRDTRPADRVHTALLDLTARRWRFILAPPGPFLAAALAPGGRVLATAVRGAIHLWDLAEPPRPPGHPARRRKRRLAPRLKLPGGAERLDAVAFSPDGRRLFAGSAVGTVRVWDVPGLPPAPPADDAGEPAAPEVLADARPAATFTWGVGPVAVLAVAPDGLTAAAGSADGRVVVWDVEP